MYKFNPCTKEKNVKTNIGGYSFKAQNKNLATKPVYPSRKNSLEYARKVSKYTHV